MPYDWSIIFRKIGFPRARDRFLPSCLCDREIALPKNHPRDVLFCLFVYFIFSEIKTQNFRDDALLVQQI